MKCDLEMTSCKMKVLVGYLNFQSPNCLFADSFLEDKANSHSVHVCVFAFEKRRKSVLTFLSACDPLFTQMTQSIKNMSLRTNQKTKEMNPHLNKDNIIIVAG